MRHTSKLLAIVLAMAMAMTLAIAASAAAPGTPKNLVLTPGDGTITATWEPPDDDGGTPIERYFLEFVEKSLSYNLSGDTFSFTFTSLENGTEYTVRVWAYNGVQSAVPATGKCTPEELPICPPPPVCEVCGEDPCVCPTPPSFFARAWQFILKWVLFGWLWGRWVG